ncbi:hypothetical protein SI65_06481 [Aspergillus cristatus]|uniref:Uncharacterized protein n=1 Tax=Aspergillus cristatus TaxID=573508 RepID=A0A1E3B9P9_ASPCR|nr:hypothetical protein SI65_06481 [Aspergillus cristatus]
MQSWILKFGALAALAQTISAAQLHIETTHPPANKYKSHCTVILEDELWGNCKGSSSPFPGGCGDNSDTKPATICGDNTVNVNWKTGQLTIKSADGQKEAKCVLSSTSQWGECNTDNPDQYPLENGASSLFDAGKSVLYGLTPIAAGLLL